ncbi:LytTR family DNA-binding domain-containing protein [Flavobacterium sp. LC2016-12]|uniref:LytR/AlgR family response regulator transcription factor n=1 Tax=Flavobacterium sp. LC2016-12 TaxID=2783794 RepID=UPI00188D29A8|nr:LytTR family transcriptional regulator DNA-binding domain-containing protein [Flavobacterium sp. LC2016-12]MBF4466083.1 LytTR family transcriptional regulator DNA-binding domain-containing protein [Flavobacterium sp. LC2016-12]
MKKYSYIIIDDDAESIMRTKTIAEGFSELTFMASATNYQDGLHMVLENKPSFVFLEIDPEDLSSNLSLAFINELHRYLAVIPKIIVTTSKKGLAFDAIQYGVFDYLLKPLMHIDLLKTTLKLEKILLQTNTVEINEVVSVATPPSEVSRVSNVVEKPLIICIKSYGDYRYLNAADIAYFQADNNSTDIYLSTGEMITAFKTLKHFESILSHPFIRIHNSYIINQNYIARIHHGNSVCYIKNSPKKIPFSKTYKSNVDVIITNFATGNYIEI